MRPYFDLARMKRRESLAAEDIVGEHVPGRQALASRPFARAGRCTAAKRWFDNQNEVDWTQLMAGEAQRQLGPRSPRCALRSMKSPSWSFSATWKTW